MSEGEVLGKKPPSTQRGQSLIVALHHAGAELLLPVLQVLPLPKPVLRCRPFSSDLDTWSHKCYTVRASE